MVKIVRTVECEVFPIASQPHIECWQTSPNERVHSENFETVATSKPPVTRLEPVR